MGCLYCGCEVQRPRRKFCSDWCCREYSRIKWWRTHQGNNKTMAHCKNCGKLLKNSQREYCSPECRARHGVTYNGYNALRLAILRQATREGRLKRWAHTESFQKLFPEIDPEYITRLAKEKRL